MIARKEQFWPSMWEKQNGPRSAMKLALDVEIGPRLGTGPRSESYIYIYIYVSTASFVRYGTAGQVYLNNRTTNNLSIDKTDNKPFMQYLFQKRQLHRIEFSDAREKGQVGECFFFSPCSANAK